MRKHLVNLDDRQWDYLRTTAESFGISASSMLRRLLDSYAPIANAVSSGAVVVGLYAQTTSGKVWVGKGF